MTDSFNKSLVICSISLDRMKLIDKLYFKDEFDGNIYIIMDDRNPIRNDVILSIENFIKNEATNINLKKANIIHYKRDMLPYIEKKINVRSDLSDVVERMIFSIPMLSSIYFCRNENDLSFVLDDDIILFKNPIYLMDGKLRTATIPAIPADICRRTNEFLGFLGDDMFSRLGLDKNAPDNNHILDRRYGRIVSQPSTIWNYQPEFPEYIRKFIESPNTIRNININRKHGSEFYYIGFTSIIENALACYLLKYNVEFYGDTFVTQDRNHFIRDYKRIYNGDVFGYHYTIINDDYVFKYLPFLFEKGPEEYKKIINSVKHEAKGSKYRYPKSSQFKGLILNRRFQKRNED